MRRAPYIRLAALILGAGLAAAPSPVFAFSRVKDLVEVEGIRDNMLVGYGLVVGLNGSGDSLKNAPFTQQSLQTMLERLGVNTRGFAMQTKNVAAVMVTASLPAFAAQGTRIDISVSALGDAKSLQGGTLLVTTLFGADGQIYAVGQGPVAIGGFTAGGDAASVTRGVPTSGRISNGAIVEREIGFSLASEQGNAQGFLSRPGRNRHRARSSRHRGQALSDSTQPFFIVSSGRSGTAMLHKALSADADMQHEYMVQIVQPLAVRRYLDLIDSNQAVKALAETHQAAVGYSAASHWGDGSNKLSWLIPELAELFPHARFVHLVRDGRKVAGSYFRKLGEECYDDRSTRILQAHYDSPSHAPAPPPEKKFWWPVPRRGDPAAHAFRSYSQFERICWHWAEINRVIIKSLAALPRERQFFVTLEGLRASARETERLYDFLNLPYRDETFSIFAKRHNINRPEDRLLDARERERFDAIAGAMMERLGYAQRLEYVVNY